MRGLFFVAMMPLAGIQALPPVSQSDLQPLADRATMANPQNFYPKSCIANMQLVEYVHGFSDHVCL